MDFVSAWLKGIILIILFATFMDLLLPNSSMQKYVKLVIGLIIIITMLTPLLVLFNGKEAFTETSFLDWQRGDAIVASAIEDVSQRMTENQQNMTNDAAKQMVINSVKNILHLQGEYKLVDLNLQTNSDQTLDDIEISGLELVVSRVGNEVEVVAGQGTNQIGITADVSGIPLIQIDEIRISNNDNDKVEENNNEENPSVENDFTNEQIHQNVQDKKSLQEIKQMISKQLEVSARSINIYIVEER